MVKILLTTMYCIAKPIARILDEVWEAIEAVTACESQSLAAASSQALVHNREERFSRPEVRSVLRAQPSGLASARLARLSVRFSETGGRLAFAKRAPSCTRSLS